jgi:hypothetical protein
VAGILEEGAGWGLKVERVKISGGGMSEQTGDPRVIYCRCAYAQVVPPEVKDGVLEHLSGGGRAFEAVADLCEMSAQRDGRLVEIAGGGPLKIAACHRRAVLWLFHAAGAPLAAEGVEVVNMRTLSAAAASARLDVAEIDSAAD